MIQIVLVFVLIAVLVGLAIVLYLSLVRQHDHTVRFNNRVLDALGERQTLSNLLPTATPLVVSTGRTAPFWHLFVQSVGADPAWLKDYPIRWWLVPLLATIPGWITATLLSFLVGGNRLVQLSTFLPATLLFSWIVFNGIHAKQRNLLFEQFPDALDIIVRCVRVGIPVAEALRNVARDSQPPTRLEFAKLADKVSIGVPLDVALRDVATGNGIAEYQFFATALTLQARSGGAITQTLETLSEVIRKRVALKARGHALTSEARTSALVLAILPFFAAGALFLIAPAYLQGLTSTARGHGVLAMAALLLALGMLSIRLMIARVLK